MMTLDECIAAARLPALDDPSINPVARGLAMQKLPIVMKYRAETGDYQMTVDGIRTWCVSSSTATKEYVRERSMLLRSRLSEQHGEKR